MQYSKLLFCDVEEGQERRLRDVGYKSVHHPIADITADMAGRRFVPGTGNYILPVPLKMA